MEFASNAFQRFVGTNDENAKDHFLLSMVVGYCRPFTSNYGIGSLLCEYPTFPDFPDADMNLRHNRMMDLRNKLLGHSSIEGTKVLLLAPGATSPASLETAIGYGYTVAKLSFTESEFVVWLHDLIKTIAKRLTDDIAIIGKEIGPKYLKPGETYLLDTGKNSFEWTK
jgi:hypothetical protein